MSGFVPDAEQRALVAAIAGPIAALLPLSRLHGDAGGDHPRLRDLAGLGCLGIALDEALGGSGLGVVEEALVFEQLGRSLVSPGVLASVIAAQVATGETARAIAGGERSVALAVPDGERLLLIDAADPADLVLRLDIDGVALFEGAALSGRRLLDAGRWSLPLAQADATGIPLATGDAGSARRAVLLCAAALSGIAAAGRDMAVDYARTREQFGRPIGTFQAVKHHCADMAVEAMAAADLTGFAAVALAGGRADAPLLVDAALSIAIRAAVRNAGLNIQIHGGIGFSDECDAHLFLKRAHVWARIAGGLDAAHARLGEERG